MKVPFGLHNQTKLYVGIDEAKRGLECNCICPSCGMQLKTRKGEENEHHFAHHKKADTECQYSYWVAVRSMTKQLIEKEKFISIDMNKQNLMCVAPYQKIDIYSIQMNPRVPDYQFDLKISSSIGVFYVYFITDSSDIGRSRTHFFNRADYFSELLILEIDLSSMTRHSSNATRHIRQLLFEDSANKEFISPHYSYCVDEALVENLIEKESEKEQTIYRKNNATSKCDYMVDRKIFKKEASFYLKAMCNIPKHDSEYDDSIDDILRSMKEFFLEGLRQSKHIYHNMYTSKYNIFHTKGKIYHFGSFSERYYAIATVEDRYLIYILSKGTIDILCETRNIEEAHIEIRNYYSGVKSL